MTNLDSRAFQKLISEFIDAKDIRSLVDKFSKDRVFYSYVLKDISMGRESVNYKILKKMARKKKVSESYIIEQAKSVLSYIAPYDEPELENYYEILNVPPHASEEEIRERWLKLMKTHHPDKSGYGGADKAKKINEAYNVLGTTSERVEYDTRHTPDIPLIVQDKTANNTSRILLYLVPFLLLIGASYLYVSSSNLMFQSESDKENFANCMLNPTLPDVEFNNKAFESNSEYSDTEAIRDEDESTAVSDLAHKEIDIEEEKISECEPKEEDRPELVKIIEEEQQDSEPQLPEIEMNQERISRPSGTTKDTSFNSKIATPVVPYNNGEVGNNELPSGSLLPDENSLYKFLSQYISAYKNRDLQTIRSLFAPNARENGVSIYKVLDTYNSNFSTLDIVRYDIQIKRSGIDNSAGIIMGDFLVTFSNTKNKLTKTSSGSITWLLRWRGHKWEIEEINYKLYGTNVIDL